MARFLTERQGIADMCRTLADQGYFAGTGGNIGVRVDDRLMAVTPSATDYYTIAAEDIVLLDIATLEVVEGDKVPTIEKSLHASMLTMFPERRVSIHTHQPVASAVALSHQVLPWPDGADLSMLGAHVAVVPYRPSGTGMLAKAFRKALKPGIFAYLMASHGVICSAGDLDGALSMIRKIDAAAASLLSRRVAGRGELDTKLQAFVLKTLEHANLKGA